MSIDISKLDLTALEGLSDQEKQLALSVLKEYADKGESETFSKLLLEDYAEVPVDINTFINDDLYLGKGLCSVDEGTGKRKQTVFPYWIKVLNQVFPNNIETAYNTLILSGAIGLGKSFVAVVAMLYMLYRMLCLKDPYKHFGLQPIDHITFSIMNITIDAAKGVAWSKIQELLQSSPWFLQHGRLSKSINPEWQPNQNIELIYGSQPRHVIGRAVFCSFEDEVSFQPTQDIEKQKKKAKELISSIDARMSSRFLHGEKLPTLHILASSKRTDQSFLETYIDMKKKNESKTTLVIDEAQWVIRTDKDSPKKFAVAVGNKFLDSEVLPLTATEDDYQLYIDKGYRILMVPMGYHEQFLDDINIALTDIAGISTSSSSNYISGVRWTQCRNDKLENPFIREVLEIGNDPADKAQYYDYFDLTKVPKEMKSRPMFIHLDMSITGDKTGIAGVWIRGKMPGASEEGSSKELFYQLAFSVSIKAPKGRQVSFEKNRQLIYWLRQQGFNIKGISYDTFNSVDLGQALQNKGFNCSVISVDRLTSAGPDTKTKVCIPYQAFRNAIYEGRFIAYPTKLLTAEIVGLVRDGNGKVDHSPAGINCLTGDTKLSLTDGRELPIKDIIAEYRQGKVNYVYSYNETSKHIEPKKITNGWCSGIADRLIKITLDNGEVIEATPEHKFLLRSGEYVCAKDLVVNDSLMPLYRKYPKEGGLKNYRMYYDPMFDQWHYEHRQFAEKVYDKKYLVHHIDCNPHNNNPDNLLWMSKSAHTKLHAQMQTGAQSPEAKKRRSDALTNWWKDNKTSEKGIAKIRYHYKGLSDKEIIAKQNAKKAEEEAIKVLRTKDLKELFNVDYTTLDTHDKRYYMSKYNNFKRGFDISKDYAKEKEEHNKELSEFFNVKFEELSETERRSLSSKYAHIKDPNYQKRVSAAVSENHKKGKYTKAKLALAECNKKSHEQCLERYHNSDKYKEILAMNTLYGIDYEKLPYNEKISYIHRYHNSLNKKIKNHKIAEIEFIDCNIPVYDITIEDNHNFALSAGIIVHNSKDCADAVCGALYDASLHSEEYEYNYGDSLEQLLTVNADSNYDDPKQLSLNLENELIAMYGQRAIKGNEKPQRVHPSDANKPTDNFTLYNDIIIL